MPSHTNFEENIYAQMLADRPKYAKILEEFISNMKEAFSFSDKENEDFKENYISKTFLIRKDIAQCYENYCDFYQDTKYGKRSKMASIMIEYYLRNHILPTHEKILNNLDNKTIIEPQKS